MPTFTRKTDRCAVIDRSASAHARSPAWAGSQSIGYKVLYRMVSGVSWLVSGACAGALKDAGGKDKVFQNARCAGLFCKYI